MTEPQVSVVGVAMTPMDRRDLSARSMVTNVVAGALSDAGLSPSDVGLVVVGNAMGGRLLDQGCVRGQAWLRDLGLGSCGVLNVDNSCAGGSSAVHVAVLAARAGASPVVAVGVEKMWTGDRAATLAGIEDGLPEDDRKQLRSQLQNDAGSILMALNATWVRHQISERGTSVEQIAATAVKSRRCASRNPLAQFHSEITVEEVLSSPIVVEPLRRLMCSSFTDGAAAVVLSAGVQRGAPRIRASVMRTGYGELDYHDRLSDTVEEAWKVSGVGAGDIDVVELHDATAAEELYALESLGFFSPGEAGAATAAGETDLGGSRVSVNPSGGLLSRGHPLGATGICQIVELVHQLRGEARGRQVQGARLGLSVNTGGIMEGRDTALAAVHVLEGA
jgi:acetyl-CoA acetyltransferase